MFLLLSLGSVFVNDTSEKWKPCYAFSHDRFSCLLVFVVKGNVTYGACKKATLTDDGVDADSEQLWIYLSNLRDS